MGTSLIPRDRPADTGGHDLVGAVTLVMGMLLTVYTMVSAPTRGWAHPMTLGSFAVAAVLLATFFFVEKKVAHPLVRLGLLRVGTIVRANLAIIALFGSYLSFQFMMTIFLQSALGWSPLKMAMALLPAGIIVAFGSPFVGRLVDLYGSAKLIIAALTSLSVGYLWFLFAGSDSPSYVVAILPSVILLGLGFALGYTSIMAQATSGVDDSEQGLASGLVNTSAQVGAALVLALTTALVTAGSHTASGAGTAGFEQFHPGLILVTGVALVGLAITVSPLVRGRSQRGRSVREMRAEGRKGIGRGQLNTRFIRECARPRRGQSCAAELLCLNYRVADFRAASFRAASFSATSKLVDVACEPRIKARRTNMASRSDGSA